MNDTTPIRSFSKANRELALSFERWLVSIHKSTPTIRAYLDPVNRLVRSLGPQPIVNCERDKIRQLFTSWCDQGLSANSRRLHVHALRNFFKFIRLTELTKHDPMVLVSLPKTPTRLPRVLTTAEVERLIVAAKGPFERAVVELLYSTGVRVSELCSLRLEDIHWNVQGPNVIRVINGKGGKDRIVLFGSKASEAIRALQSRRPSKGGFLLESQRLHTRVTPQHIRQILARIAHAAGIKGVHPHALRRAFASHMLQNGGNLRAIQDLLGHENVSTTQRYTSLTAEQLTKIHHKFHPHGGSNAKKK